MRYTCRELGFQFSGFVIVEGRGPSSSEWTTPTWEVSTRHEGPNGDDHTTERITSSWDVSRLRGVLAFSTPMGMALNRSLG